MSGHSKWHSIRHKKAANDLARGKILTKHSKILMIMGKTDPNPETNAPLRNAISNAKSDGVPKNNIEKILKKLSGVGNDDISYSEQLYEGFGPEGVPILVGALTDNPNRTFPSVRTAFEKNGGKIGSSGAVKFLFNHIGVIFILNEDKDEEVLFELAIEAGADDFIYGEEESEIITTFENLGKVRDNLEGKIKIRKFQPEYRPKDPIIVNDEKVLEKLNFFIEKIEEAEDVDDVFAGFEVSDDLL